jgi:hypothetical protein
VEDLNRQGQLTTLVRRRWTGQQHLTDTYRFVNDVPLRNSDDALLVSWCELTTTNDADRVLFRNAWATSHRIDEHNLEPITKAGRARWKIENEGNNTLKTKGYHFEHNYGHGKQHLANLLATMILLAYLTHTTLDWLDDGYRAVRAALPSRETFFQHIRALLQYLPFESWEQLFRFMLSKLEPHDTG